MRLTPFSNTRGMQLLLTLVLGAVVALSSVLTPRPAPVEARCYGKYAAKCQGYVTRCLGGCGSQAGIIGTCAKKDFARRKAQCRQTFKQVKGDCVGDRNCVQLARSTFQSCTTSGRNALQRDKRDISGRGYGRGACNRCCGQTDGQGECTSYFSGSRWYGSHRSYGKVNCVSTGSPSAAFFPHDFSGDVRSHLAALLPWLTSNWSR